MGSSSGEDRPSRRRRPPAAVRAPFQVGGESVAAGTRLETELRAARLSTGTWMSLPVEVVHGAHEGSIVWLSAAIHGDEINGVQIIRRVLPRLDPRRLRGTVVAVPIVNVFGFIEQSRYLPDRRDLNRSFPGSQRGSLASRLAHLFISEVVSKCQYGIDLHTGSNHRTNLPQIRGDLGDPETLRCAEAFGAPVMIHARLRDGSLREAAAARGIHTLLYECGEALRFDMEGIRVGEAGVLRVLQALGMLDPGYAEPVPAPRRAASTTWVRARRSGILDLQVAPGDAVHRNQVLATIGQPIGDKRLSLRSPVDGLVIGCLTNPLINQGDAVVHLAVLD